MKRMPELLPRIVKVKLTTEPRRAYVCMAGAKELAKMVDLPEGVPVVTIAQKFISDFNRGKLQPKPILFGARFEGLDEL